MIGTDRIASVVAAVLAVVLQVFLAPHISIGYAVPNFVAAACIALAVSRAGALTPAAPFVLGLLYDLISGGPVGAMAFTLTVASTFAGWLFKHTNNDTVFMALVALLAGVFFVEFAYGAFFLLFGYATGFVEAVVYRMLPCLLYDLVLTLVVYFLLVRFVRPDVPLTSEIRQLH